MNNPKTMFDRLIKTICQLKSTGLCILIGLLGEMGTCQIQVYYTQKNLQIQEATISKMLQSGIRLEQQIKDGQQKIGRLDVLEVDQQFLGVARGLMDVFCWDGNEWKYLYKHPYFGHNFYSKNFTFQNEIYSFGGYGYWIDHGRLMHFCMEKHQWELISCTQNLRHSLAHITNEGLRLLGSNSSDIDIKYNQISLFQPKYDHGIFAKKSNNREIEFEQFVYYPNNNPLLMYDKKTETPYQSEFGSLISSNDASSFPLFFHVFGDSLKVFDHEMILKGEFDIKQYVSKYYSVASAPLTASLYDKLMLILPLTMGIFGFVLFGRKLKPKRKKTESEYTKLIAQLLTLEKSILTMSELDQFLGIQNIENADTLKFKRNQFISEINRLYEYSHRKKLIIRKKESNDRRRIYYELNK